MYIWCSLHPWPKFKIIWVCESPAILFSVQWRFDNIEINYLNFSRLTGIFWNLILSQTFSWAKSLKPLRLLKTTEKVIRLNFYINQMCEFLHKSDVFSPKSWENCYVTVQDYRQRFGDPYYFEFACVWDTD